MSFQFSINGQDYDVKEDHVVQRPITIDNPNSGYLARGLIFPVKGGFGRRFAPVITTLTKSWWSAALIRPSYFFLDQVHGFTLQDSFEQSRNLLEGLIQSAQKHRHIVAACRQEGLSFSRKYIEEEHFLQAWEALY